MTFLHAHQFHTGDQFPGDTHTTRAKDIVSWRGKNATKLAQKDLSSSFSLIKLIQNTNHVIRISVFSSEQKAVVHTLPHPPRPPTPGPAPRPGPLGPPRPPEPTPPPSPRRRHMAKSVSFRTLQLGRSLMQLWTISSQVWGYFSQGGIQSYFGILFSVPRYFTFFLGKLTAQHPLLHFAPPLPESPTGKMVQTLTPVVCPVEIHLRNSPTNPETSFGGDDRPADSDIPRAPRFAAPEVKIKKIQPIALCGTEDQNLGVNPTSRLRGD
ncbi:hypothetical protein SCAR479_07015 [Seiridium cardinale]|uniref:Uncharacterized protein n=1 Tax=Seiridium cardinale TaxID=138064 RepID=A0ABR2XRE6_9PEZI